jgi:hypothetical protein
VVTNALRFGSRVVQRLATGLRQYIDRDRLRARLSPVADGLHSFDAAFHVTASTLDLCTQLNGEHVLVWDAGKGSRMGLLVSDRPKGDIELVHGIGLRRFAAAAAQRMVDELKDCGGDYTALVASDQVVCLDNEMSTRLKPVLTAAVAQKADLIFFDGPPALSVRRLHPLLDGVVRPRRDSMLVIARDRILLKHHGGAHVFQCALVRAPLRHLLADALQALVRAADKGCDLDFGVMDVAVVPRFVDPVWLNRETHAGARQVYQALAALRSACARVFPISVPIEVFNVNTSTMLQRLQRCIVPPRTRKGAMS